MRIDPEKCVACGNCLPVCPVGAIHVEPRLGRAVVNEDECVECFACYRGMSKEHLNPVMVRAIRRVAGFFRFRFDPEPDICPTDAITPQELQWPRIVRRAFSDPQVPHESTGIHGRGTAEVKTNDVTGRVKEGEAGFVVEFGRPGVGARFRDIQRVTAALSACGVEFEKNNPVTSLMTDPSKGLIREDILNERILSAIVDNIPIMFAVLSMNPDMSLGQWLLVTLTAGVGGSLLSIGSAAGVALMGQARGAYTFFVHLKWTWAVVLGYMASIGAHLLLNAHTFS